MTKTTKTTAPVATKSTKAAKLANDAATDTKVKATAPKAAAKKDDAVKATPPKAEKAAKAPTATKATTPKAEKKEKAAKEAKPEAKPEVVSKKSLAMPIIAADIKAGVARKDTIAKLLAPEVGCSAAGANTYYQNVKSGAWK